MNSFVPTCRNCGKSCYPKPGGGYYDYCGRTCASNSSVQTQVPKCRRCGQSCYPKPGGGYYDYCGKSCASKPSYPQGTAICWCGSLVARDPRTGQLLQTCSKH